MTPPSMGPNTLARMKTVDTMAMYFPNSEGGTSSVAMTMIIEYMPEAPTP